VLREIDNVPGQRICPARALGEIKSGMRSSLA
jgi:hypothetical protein